jgi:hypothetical protein
MLLNRTHNYPIKNNLLVTSSFTHMFRKLQLTKYIDLWSHWKEDFQLARQKYLGVCNTSRISVQVLLWSFKKLSKNCSEIFISILWSSRNSQNTFKKSDHWLMISKKDHQAKTSKIQRKNRNARRQKV